MNISFSTGGIFYEGHLFLKALIHSSSNLGWCILLVLPICWEPISWIQSFSHVLLSTTAQKGKGEIAEKIELIETPSMGRSLKVRDIPKFLVYNEWTGKGDGSSYLSRINVQMSCTRRWLNCSKYKKKIQLDSYISGPFLILNRPRSTWENLKQDVRVKSF